MPMCPACGCWNFQTYCAKPNKLESLRLNGQRNIELLGGLPIAVDYTPGSIADNLKLATKYGLSSYDAAYLELAIRLRLPMATKDGGLVAAATRAGIEMVE